MTEPQICKCPNCGTALYVMLAIAPQGGFLRDRDEWKEKAEQAIPIQIKPIWKEGYDVSKCQEPVSNDGWITEYQCPRANGYGSEKAWCKQHAKGHPEEKMMV